MGTVTVNVGLSPGNRFLLLTNPWEGRPFLHNRLTGQTHTWDRGQAVAGLP